MSGERALLLRTLEEHLIPVIRSAGFEQLALQGDRARSPEIRFGFPLGYMKRLRGSEHDLIEIQVDKRGRAKFVLNCGVVPPEGATLPWRHYDQAEASVSALPEWYRLHDCRGCLKWFGVSWFSLSSNLDAKVLRSVDRAIALLPEVESWFAAGTVGPHMRRVGYPIRVAKVPSGAMLD